MKKGLKILLIALAAILLISLAAPLFGTVYFMTLIASGNDAAAKDEIFAYVSEHEENLLQAVESGDLSAFEGHGIIREIRIRDGVIEFYCGGTGIGSATAYTGFFYSPSGDITALWDLPDTSSATHAGSSFTWQEEGGDNRLYAERICGNFFYYHESY